LGYEGLQNLQRFVKNGGVYIGAVGTAQFAILCSACQRSRTICRRAEPRVDPLPALRQN